MTSFNWTLLSSQAKQMYNSLQRHSTSGLTASSSTKSGDALDVDYDNVEDCGGGAVGGGIGDGGMGGIVVHGDSGDSGVIVRESRQPGGGGAGRTMGDGMGEILDSTTREKLFKEV